MAKHFIQQMHMHKGALTAKAKARGESVSEIIAHPPAGADATTKREINLAKTLRKLRGGIRIKKR